MFKFKLEGAASTLLSYWWAIRPAIKYTMIERYDIQARIQEFVKGGGGHVHVSNFFSRVAKK